MNEETVDTAETNEGPQSLLASFLDHSTLRPAEPSPFPVGAAWADASLPAAERADLLLAEMTLEEKTGLLSGRGLRTDGTGGVWQAFIQGIDRLGIPDVTQGDSPAGVLIGPQGLSQIPSEHALGASFAPEVAQQAARVLGAEAASAGYRVWHAPTLDVTRDYRHGRSHENFGEDVHLVSLMGEHYARGLHDEGIVADVKHFGLNTVETERLHTDCAVDPDRVVGHYLAPFRSVLHNEPIHMVMTAYAKINGHHVNDVPEYFDLLRKEWGIDPIVRNDAEAVHTLGSLAHGLDQEFRDELHFGEELRAAVTAGEIPESVVDTTVRRILRVMAESGLLDRAPRVTPRREADVDALRGTAERGAVVLKNDGILPLAPDTTASIAVFGPAASDGAIAGGPTHAGLRRDVFLDALAEVAPSSSIRYVPAIDAVSAIDTLPGYVPFPSSGVRGADQADAGFDATFFDAQGEVIERRAGDRLAVHAENWALAGIGAQLLPPRNATRAELRGTWTADAGVYGWDAVGGGQATLTVDGEVLLRHDGGDDRHARSEASADLGKGEHEVVLEYVFPSRQQTTFVQASAAHVKIGLDAADLTQPAGIRAAAEIAASSDIAVVVVRDLASEGTDRSTLRLPGHQDALVAAVAAANPRTIVVLETASAVLTDWRDDVAAIVQGWYGGSFGNAAIARVLTGLAEPGGRLPVTFPQRDEDLPTFAPERFPGVAKTVSVDEPETGYRYFQGADVPAPAFPFGFGLSYTSWEFSDFSVPERVEVEAGTADTARRVAYIPVSVRVHNTGDRDGYAVPQLYVRRPGGEVGLLKAFRSVFVRAGETREVDLSVAHVDLAHYARGAWTIASGAFEFALGTDALRTSDARTVEVVTA